MLKWYVLFYPLNISNLLRQLRMVFNNENIYYPTYKKRKFKKKKNKIQVMDVPFFPHYIFIRCDIHKDFNKIYKICKTKPVFLKMGLQFGVVTEEEIEHLRKLEAEWQTKEYKQVEFEVGNEVIITEGPFNNFIGRIKELNLNKGIATVEIQIFGRLVPANIPFEHLELV
ncbi:MAG: transcription termination/antitermination protein NusG [Promethearchaeota archaeon]